jgi:hypothetical protein
VSHGNAVALGRAVLELMRQHLARWLAEQRVERSADQFIGPNLPVGGSGVALGEQMAGDLASPPLGIVVALVAVAVGSKVAPELVRDHNWGNRPLRALTAW